MAREEPTFTGDVVVDPAGHRVRVWRYGCGSQTLVALHGGPGYDHRHLLGFAGLAADDLQVVLYDQLGSGVSDRPDDPALWRIERFVDELEAIRTELDLGPIHLAGHSWGGVLAQQYVLTHPGAVRSLVLANTAASIADIGRSFDAVRSRLPRAAYRELRRHEAAGDWDAPAYQQAIAEHVLARHFRRSTPFDLAVSLRELLEQVMPLFDAPGPARETMYGNRPFEITGNLVGWDATERLREVGVPALVLSGAHDAISPECGRTIAEGIPGSELVIFGQSSHMVMLEHEAPSFFAVIERFVRRHAA